MSISEIQANYIGHSTNGPSATEAVFKELLFDSSTLSYLLKEAKEKAKTKNETNIKKDDSLTEEIKAETENSTEENSNETITEKQTSTETTTSIQSSEIKEKPIKTKLSYASIVTSHPSKKENSKVMSETNSNPKIKKMTTSFNNTNLKSTSTNTNSSYLQIQRIMDRYMIKKRGQKLNLKDFNGVEGGKLKNKLGQNTSSSINSIKNTNDSMNGLPASLNISSLSSSSSENGLVNRKKEAPSHPIHQISHNKFSLSSQNLIRRIITRNTITTPFSKVKMIANKDSLNTNTKENQNQNSNSTTATNTISNSSSIKSKYFIMNRNTSIINKQMNSHTPQRITHNPYSFYMELLNYYLNGHNSYINNNKTTPNSSIKNFFMEAILPFIRLNLKFPNSLLSLPPSSSEEKIKSVKKETELKTASKTTDLTEKVITEDEKEIKPKDEIKKELLEVESKTEESSTFTSTDLYMSKKKPNHHKKKNNRKNKAKKNKKNGENNQQKLDVLLNGLNADTKNLITNLDLKNNSSQNIIKNINLKSIEEKETNSTKPKTDLKEDKKSKEEKNKSERKNTNVITLNTTTTSTVNANQNGPINQKFMGLGERDIDNLTEKNTKINSHQLAKISLVTIKKFMPKPASASMRALCSQNKYEKTNKKNKNGHHENEEENNRHSKKNASSKQQHYNNKKKSVKFNENEFEVFNEYAHQLKDIDIKMRCNKKSCLRECYRKLYKRDYEEAKYEYNYVSEEEEEVEEEKENDLNNPYSVIEDTDNKENNMNAIQYQNDMYNPNFEKYYSGTEFDYQNKYFTGKERVKKSLNLEPVEITVQKIIYEPLKSFQSQSRRSQKKNKNNNKRK